MERHYVIGRHKAIINATVNAETIGDLIEDLRAIAMLLRPPPPPLGEGDPAPSPDAGDRSSSP